MSTTAGASPAAGAKGKIPNVGSYTSVLDVAAQMSGSGTPTTRKMTPACYTELFNKIAAIKAGAKEKDAAARVAACTQFAELSKDVETENEAFLANELPIMIELFGDKDKAVREASEAAGKALVSNMQSYSLVFVLPLLFEAMKHSKWQVKLAALNILKGACETRGTEINISIPDIIPAVTETMNDVRREVQEAGTECMKAVCAHVGNRDIEEFIPVVIHTIANPAEMPETIHKVAGTTFVQQVEPAALSVMVPLLARGLVEGVTAIKRKAAVIIENMCKMVEVPEHAAPFVPHLLPLLERASDEVADPECRLVTAKAAQVLTKAAGSADQTASVKAEPAQVLVTLNEIIASTEHRVEGEIYDTVLRYVAATAATLINANVFHPEEWYSHVQGFLNLIVGHDPASDITEALRSKTETAAKAKGPQEEEEEGEVLCDCEFTLGYGAKILLNATKLKMMRGRRYGLCGPNGAGKSTLMRAIANGQVEGFPSPDVLRTVYVEHDIQSDLADLSVIDYIFADTKITAWLEKIGTQRPEVIETLASVGFNETMRNAPITSLSGGWKMKLALARAMLMKADIFLLDEPTNHLDVTNVAWLVNYLTGLTNVTSMIVSHDSKFLDNVCTDIIHYENLKLKRYKGNLSAFVKVKPEARAYYSLEETQIRWKWPEPGYLPGVKARERAIFKMKDVSFKYPGTDRWILQHVSIYLSLCSRVAVLGPNGAGKSTMIKLLVGELEAVAGDVWKHPNMRYAYVAQHAFHHLEHHLDMTPNEYILWRFSNGMDKESTSKVNKDITPEEEKKMNEPVVIDGVKRVIDRIIGRREARGDFEYEITWKARPTEENMWFEKDKLVKLGWGKVIEQVDEKETARKAGMYLKPLTKANVEKHLADFGLEPEFGTHSRVRGLSGGQKVKTVLAAAMWQQPHILVLDEPTNYLDRDSIGAMVQAIKDFQGGVVMITHHSEFHEALCQERWTVKDGRLIAEGTPDEFAGEQTKQELKIEEEVKDALGNTVKVKKELSKKEQKKKDKERRKKEAKGEEVWSDED